MTLSYKLDLDIHPLDLHTKIQVCMSVCLAVRVVTRTHTHTQTQTHTRCQNYYTRHMNEVWNNQLIDPMNGPQRTACFAKSCISSIVGLVISRMVLVVPLVAWETHFYVIYKWTGGINWTAHCYQSCKQELSDKTRMNERTNERTSNNFFKLRVQYFLLCYLLQGPESWRSITFLFFMNMNMLIRRIIKSCNTDIFDRRKHIASVSCLELMRYDCPYLLYLISCRKFPRSHVSYHTIIISGYLWLVLGIFHASFCLKVYDSC